MIQVGGEDDEYEAWLAAHEPDPEIHPVDPDDCFVQLYTSGTTGFPKGALLTHRAMLAHSANVAVDFELGPDAIVQVAMPLFHVGGTSYALLAVSCGARIEMMRLPDPAAALEMVERERITHTFWVPALMAAMTQVPGVADRDYSSLRSLSYGASPMPLPVMRTCMELFPGRMHQVYGMTEACGVVSSLGPADHADPTVAHRLVSAGTPIHGVEIEIRDPATGEPVPVGEPGEVWVRTEQLMGGYWRNPDATAAAITPDGWLRSGDGGHMDADGYIYVTDRIKDMIISGGENIYPAEIERVLAEHPTVADVAVIGVPDERWGEVPKAVVVPAPGAGRRRPRAAGLLPRAPRVVQVPEDGGRDRRAPAQPHRQGAQEGPPRPVLEGLRAPGRLIRWASDGHPKAMGHHLTQVNVARLRAPLESATMQGFVAALGPMHELAASCPGFVWRLASEDGGHGVCVSTDDGGPAFVNLSVWTDYESLHAFVYRSAHGRIVRSRSRWFVATRQPSTALWWVPPGSRPTVDDALVRLRYLREHGPSPRAFSLRRRFAPDGTPVRR